MMEVKKCQNAPVFSGSTSIIGVEKMQKHLGEGGYKVVQNACKKLCNEFDDSYAFELQTKKTLLWGSRLKVIVTKTLGVLPNEAKPQTVRTSFTLYRNALASKYRIHCANIINDAKIALEKGKAKKIVDKFNQIYKEQELLNKKHGIHRKDKWTAPPYKKGPSSLDLNLNI